MSALAPCTKPHQTRESRCGSQLCQLCQGNLSCTLVCHRSIDTENLGEVLAAGAERVAVVRALMQSAEPTLTAQFFAAQLHRQQTLQNLEEATA